MALIHLIYCSASTEPDMDKEALQTLLDNCRKANKSREVTGMLLFHQGTFFQILEGYKRVVMPLFRKISADPRHERVTKLIVEPIEERAFDVWSMGYPTVTPQDLRKIKGLNDFFTSGKSFHELDQGRAKALLEAFKEGRWHPQAEAC